jgi:hypothetical protein
LTVANNVISLTVDENTVPDDYVQAIGQAKVLVVNHFYEPTAVVMSAAISDAVSNSQLFSAAGGKPDSQLETGGFVGRVKGLPAYEAPSSVVPDDAILVVNRELVMHRTFVPPMIHGPFPTYDPTTGKMIAAENWYIESFEGSDAPVPEKGSLVLIS